MKCPQENTEACRADLQNVGCGIFSRETRHSSVVTRDAPCDAFLVYVTTGHLYTCRAVLLQSEACASLVALFALVPGRYLFRDRSVIRSENCMAIFSLSPAEAYRIYSLPCPADVRFSLLCSCECIYSSTGIFTRIFTSPYRYSSI